VQMALKVLLIT